MVANTPFSSLFLHYTGCPLVAKSSLLGMLRNYRESKTMQSIEEDLKKASDKKVKAILYVQRAFLEVQAAHEKEAKRSMELALEMDESVGNVYVFSYLEACCHAIACDFDQATKLLIRTRDLLQDSTHAHLKSEIETKVNACCEQNKLIYEKVWSSFFSKAPSTGSLISAEELDFNIAVSLYNSCQYAECVKIIDDIYLAADSKAVAYCYYMRGSSYLFMNSASEQSLNDLENAYKLDKQEETGRILKMNQDLLKDETKVNKMFYKLINDEIIYAVFSYLPIYSVMQVSSTCRLWRHLAAKSLSRRDYLDISYENFINNIDSHLNAFNSTKGKSEKPLQPYHIFDQVIKSSLFDFYSENVMDKRVAITEYAFHFDPNPVVWIKDVYHEYISYEKRFLKNVKVLHIPLYTWFKDEVQLNKFFEKNCSNVEELVLFSPHLERELENDKLKPKAVMDVIYRIPQCVKKVTFDFVLLERDFPADVCSVHGLKFPKLDYVNVNDNRAIIERLFQPHFPNVEVNPIEFRSNTYYKRDYPYRIVYYEEPKPFIRLY
ncbi:hypothetical protein NAEGRDRAFT_82151 [Naegleria gruberi]|uniref:F-box domain-containing protein n=1 Tax=Naegleria gruberi TaxID=5762 RepID=D2W2K6_NAEGR|nr:uncharacterized protein NAEGRDRAFT_82151 [Naegleria gruberi]EFC36762.1 hypothetical protein NAEGRDRAFT_82151 [Naegleria gruberi]|eukprot:XP_002669506.1 hypothetical protein NAEGRDRAFT_82151 [Naegleria gruberi strain NEG-M]